jgi:hypothetical protein
MLNKSLFVIGALAIVGAANAQVNHFFWTSGSQANLNTNALSPSTFGNGAGEVKAISSEYNQTTKELSYHANIAKTSDGKTADGFWLVMSKGPNPKGVAGELATFYFDASGEGTPKLSVYGYNGVNGSDSFKDGSPREGIQSPDRIKSASVASSYVKNLTKSIQADGSVTLGFKIDATTINNRPGVAGWEGAQFSNSIGLWFHPTQGTQASYDPNGYLSTFSYRSSGWVDTDNLCTGSGPAPVPEPASMAALGLGLAGLLKRKRNKKS